MYPEGFKYLLVNAIILTLHWKPVLTRHTKGNVFKADKNDEHKYNGTEENRLLKLNETINDIFFDLLPKESVVIGEPINATVNVQNRGKNHRKIKFDFGANLNKENGSVERQLNISGLGKQLKKTIHGLHSEMIELAPGKGSPEERRTIAHVARTAGIPFPETPKVTEDDVFFDLLPLESVQIGQPIQIIVKIENRGRKYYTVDLILGADSIRYNGDTLRNLDVSRGTSNDHLYKRQFCIAPRQNEIVRDEISPEIYLNYVNDSEYFRIHASAVVNDTHQVWHKEDNLYVLKPKLTLEMPKDLQVGRSFTLKLSFKNPLNRELHNCRFVMEANCLSKSLQCPFRNVQPMENVTYEVQLTPEHRGECNVIAVFHSDTLTQVAGSKKAMCS